MPAFCCLAVARRSASSRPRGSRVIGESQSERSSRTTESDSLALPAVVSSQIALIVPVSLLPFVCCCVASFFGKIRGVAGSAPLIHVAPTRLLPFRSSPRQSLTNLHKTTETPRDNHSTHAVPDHQQTDKTPALSSRRSGQRHNLPVGNTAETRPPPPPHARLLFWHSTFHRCLVPPSQLAAEYTTARLV